VAGDAYKDPNVTMTHVYNACASKRVLGLCVLDLYVLLMYVGLFGNLNDTLLKLAGLRSSMESSFSDEVASLARGASAASLASLASGGGAPAAAAAPP
jgi:hypothetical protein